MKVFEIKYNNLGPKVTLRRRIIAFTFSSLYVILQDLLKENKWKEAVEKYGAETGKRFKFLYKIFSPELLIKIGSRMTRDLGWFDIFNIRRNNNMFICEAESFAHKECPEEIADLIFRFLMEISEEIIKKSGVSESLKIKEYNKISKSKYLIKLEVIQ